MNVKDGMKHMKLELNQTILAVFIGALASLLTSAIALVHAKDNSVTCTVSVGHGKETHVHIGRVRGE